MTLQVHAIASGSSGNATLVQYAGTNVLIDAGVSLRKIVAALAKRKVGIGDLACVLVTHEHVDHIGSAAAVALRYNAPLISTPGTLNAMLEREAGSPAARALATGCEMGIGALAVRAFAVPHDAVDPCGFVLDGGQWRVAYATDCGTVTVEVREALRGATLAILEANHELDALWRGPYTPAMKARVASDTGHLSNAACADALAERLEEGGPLAVWLAHLSRVNNSPSLARRSVSAGIATRTRVAFSLEIALRDHPSVSWYAGHTAVQLSLL